MLKKIMPSQRLLPLAILILLYLFTRLFNLLALPIFTDESIYIYWAKVIEDTHTQFFIPLTDGKPPLLIWMIAALLSVLPSDFYLLAGRLPSVFSGLVALIAIYKLTENLFTSRRAALIAGLFYIISPMTLFYDRMALFDSMLTATLLTSVYFAVRTGKTRKLTDALLWGIFLGLAFLSKPTALVFLPLTVFAAFILLPVKEVKKDWKHLSGLSLLAVLIGEGMNNLQRVSNAYPAMLRKNAQFQQPIAELLKNPFLLTFGNLKGFFFWTIEYMTIPFFVFGIVAFLYGLYKRSKEVFLLFVLWFVPLFLLATVGREVFPRYILIVVPYFLIVAAYLVNVLLDFKGIMRYGVYILLTLILFPLLAFDILLLTTPQFAPLPQSDKNQYITEHPSGYGLETVYDFIREKSETQKITIVTQGTFGLYPYAFYLEFWGNPNVVILPKWPLDTIDEEIVAASEKGQVYVILKEHDEIPQTLPLELVLRATKPGGMDPILVTEFKKAP